VKVPPSDEVLAHMAAMRNRPGAEPVRVAGPADRAAAARHMLAMRDRDGGAL
jgi:hypothetical protein